MEGTINVGDVTKLILLIQFLFAVIAFVYGGIKLKIKETYLGYSRKTEKNRRAKEEFEESGRIDNAKLIPLSRYFVVAIIVSFLIPLLITISLVIFHYKELMIIPKNFEIPIYIFLTILVALLVFISLTISNNHYSKKLREFR